MHMPVSERAWRRAPFPRPGLGSVVDRVLVTAGALQADRAELGQANDHFRCCVYDGLHTYITMTCLARRDGPESVAYRRPPEDRGSPS